MSPPGMRTGPTAGPFATQLSAAARPSDTSRIHAAELLDLDLSIELAGSTIAAALDERMRAYGRPRNVSAEIEQVRRRAHRALDGHLDRLLRQVSDGWYAETREMLRGGTW